MKKEKAKLESRESDDSALQPPAVGRLLLSFSSHSFFLLFRSPRKKTRALSPTGQSASVPPSSAVASFSAFFSPFAPASRERTERARKRRTWKRRISLSSHLPSTNFRRRRLLILPVGTAVSGSSARFFFLCALRRTQYKP